MNDHEIPFGKSVHEMLVNLAEDLEVPIVLDIPCGHLPEHVALRLGAHVEIKQSGNNISIHQSHG
jgi:muramoyltetrapeptide carboxypeptidase